MQGAPPSPLRLRRLGIIAGRIRSGSVSRAGHLDLELEDLVLCCKAFVAEQWLLVDMATDHGQDFACLHV